MSNRITNKFLKSLNFTEDARSGFSPFWYYKNERYLLNYIKENNLLIVLGLDETVATEYTVNKTTFLKLLTLYGVING